MTDPSLIIYAPVRVFGTSTIITNGDQTDTIREGLAAGKNLFQALRARAFEPDAPNYTPPQQDAPAGIGIFPQERGQIEVFHQTGLLFHRMWDEHQSVMETIRPSTFPNAILNVHPALIPSFCGAGFYGLHVHEAALSYWASMRACRLVPPPETKTVMCFTALTSFFAYSFFMLLSLQSGLYPGPHRKTERIKHRLGGFGGVYAHPDASIGNGDDSAFQAQASLTEEGDCLGENGPFSLLSQTQF